MNRFIQGLMGAAMLAMLALTSLTASAEGFYFGVGGYSASMDTGEVDDDDVVPAGFLGYQFIDSNIFMLSAELGYYDLGAYTGSGYDVDSDALTLGAVGYLPIGPFFEIYAKAGIASVNVDVEVLNEKSAFGGEEAFGGVGFSFDILDIVDIYAEYLVFDTEVDSEMIGVGVRFDFF